jgi:hypothetical protein
MSAAMLGLLQATDRNGATAGRLEIRHWPVSVGRGLDADLLLDDSHVAAEHLRIDRSPEGEIRVEVLETANGVSLGAKHYGRGQSFVWPATQALNLGRLKLGLRLAEEPVVAEEPLPRFPWRGVAWTTVGLLAMLAVVLGQSWLTLTEPSQFSRQLPGSLGMTAVAIVVWAGLWALVTKLFTHRPQFWRHVRIACFSSVAIQLALLLASILAFSFSLETLARFGSLLLLLGVAASVYLHLGVIAPQRRRSLALLVAGLAVLAIVVMGGSNWLQNKRLSNKLYMSAIFPPSWRLAPAVPARQFIDEAGALRERLEARLKDKEAEDAAGGDDDGDSE